MMLLLALADGDLVNVTAIIDLASKITVTGGFLLFIIGLYTKRIVWGWQYEECDVERRTLRDLASKRADKIESDLERVRASREG